MYFRLKLPLLFAAMSCVNSAASALPSINPAADRSTSHLAISSTVAPDLTSSSLSTIPRYLNSTTTSTISFDFITINGTTFIRPSSTSFYSRSIRNITAPAPTDSHVPPTTSEKEQETVRVSYVDATHHEDTAASFTAEPTRALSSTGQPSTVSGSVSTGRKTTSSTSDIGGGYTSTTPRTSQTGDPGRGSSSFSARNSGRKNATGGLTMSSDGRGGSDAGFTDELDFSTSTGVSISGEGDTTRTAGPDSTP